MSLATFSVFFWSLAGVILLMLLNEDKLLALEERYDTWRKNKK